MSPLLRRWLPVFLCVFLIGVAFVAQAADQQGSGDAALTKFSNEMATYLYCGVKGLITGNVGLLLGLILAATGVWVIIQGHSLASGISMIIFGTIVTALPVIVESSLSGMASLLKESGIAFSAFSVPEACQNAPAPADISDVDLYDMDTPDVEEGIYLDEEDGGGGDEMDEDPGTVLRI